MDLRTTAILGVMLAAGAIACGGDDDFDDRLPQGSSPKKTFSVTVEPGPGEALAPGDGQQQTGSTSASQGQPSVKARPKLQ